MPALAPPLGICHRHSPGVAVLPEGSAGEGALSKLTAVVRVASSSSEAIGLRTSLPC